MPTGSPSSSGNRALPTLSSAAFVSEALEPGFIAGRPGADNDFHCEFKDVDGNVRVIDDDFTVGVGSATFSLAPIGAEIGTCALWNSFDYQPAIVLTKVNTPTSVRGDLDPPAVVTSTYVATNPGNTPLVDVFVVDNKCGPVTPVPPVGFNVGDTNQNGRLEPGEAWQFSCVREAVTSEVPPAGITVVNTAVVQGTDPSGDVVTATASANATAFVPGITLTKLVNGQPVVEVVEWSRRDLHLRGRQHRQHTARRRRRSSTTPRRARARHAGQTLPATATGSSTSVRRGATAAYRSALSPR